MSVEGGRFVSGGLNGQITLKLSKMYQLNLLAAGFDGEIV
jgi:hypothetical protein